jgi:hypothetical protein
VRVRGPRVGSPTRSSDVRALSNAEFARRSIHACRELTTKTAREKEATAEALAHIAEFDERKLYLPAAYESMLAYGVGDPG